MTRSAVVLELHRLHEREPFAWGAADCATLAADCALALTGRDPLAAVRGRYATALGARRVLTRMGWGSLAGFAAAHYPEIPAALAHVGDWALVDGAAGLDGTALGIVAGATIVVRGVDGLLLLPRSAARRAWRVE